MALKADFIKTIEENHEFAFVDSNYFQEEFQSKSKDFLGAKSYEKLEKHAEELINLIFEFHDKGDAVPPSMTQMDFFEKNVDYANKDKQRQHYIHSVNVFILGLYIFRNFEYLREKVTQEMQDTTENKTVESDSISYDIRYSGGSETKEFLYRWRMAALSHDLSYAISLLGNNREAIIGYVNSQLKKYNKSICEIKKLWEFDGKNLLCDLNRITGMDLKDVTGEKCLSEKYDIYFDHGVISALLLLRLVYEEFEKHDTVESNYGGGHIIWDKSILGTSVLQVANAIALHNLDKAKSLSCEECNRIYSMDRSAFVWLLKVADTLQEWDKFKVEECNKDMLIGDTEINFSFKDKEIIICNFPKPKDISDEWVAKYVKVRLADKLK